VSTELGESQSGYLEVSLNNFKHVFC
jgi:hypothetical protein